MDDLTFRSGANCFVEPKQRCRVCVKKLDTEGIPIFGDGKKPDISADLITLGSIELSRDDDLPRSLCEDCLKWLKSAVLFRDTAQQSDLLLRRRQKGKHNALLRKYTKPITKNDSLSKFKTKINSALSKNNFINITTNPAFLSLDTDEIKQNIAYIKKEKFEDVVDKQIDTVTDKYDSESCKTVMLIASNGKKGNKTDSRSSGELTEYPENSVKSKSEETTCEICKNIYTSHYYREHLKRVHRVVYAMPEQDIFVTKEISIKRQVNLTNEDGQDNWKNQSEETECQICKNTYNSHYYKEHLKRVHRVVDAMPKQEIFLTNQEHKSDDQEISIKRQVNLTNGDGQDRNQLEEMECEICNDTYFSNYYKEHLKRVHKVFDGITEHLKYQEIKEDTRRPEYICDQCGRIFNYRDTFSNHCLTHTDVLPQQCHYCPYRTRTKAALTIHLRRHTGDYKYNCTQCSARYRTKSNLNTHMRRHIGAKDFICDQCSRGFYSKLELEMHIKAVHLGIKNHICNICGKAFGYRKQLTKHTRCVHNREKLACGRLPLYLQMELKKKEAEEKEALLFNVCTT